MIMDNKSKVWKLESLLKTGEILNSKQDTNTILDTLLTKSIKLIEGADAGAIFLYNKKENLLIMRAFKGMGDSVKDVKLKPGESMTGLAFESKKALIFSKEEVKNTMANMRESNTKLAIKGNVSPSKVKGSICCPLIYRDKGIGVLVIDNFNSKVSLKEEDLEFLKAISVQATIAIMNAQNFEREIENNKKLERYNEIIKNQRNKYKYATNVHTKFTDMVLNGRKIEDIVIELKKLLDRDIFIVDLFYNVAYHTIKEDKKLNIINEQISNFIGYLNKKEKTIYKYNEISYNIFPIMVNKETLGWLCVLSETNLKELDVITAERASTIIALELLKQKELSIMEQSLKGDFLNSLIFNSNPYYIKKGSKRYGFNLKASHMIIIIDFTLDKKDMEDEYDKELRKAINNYYQILNEKLKLYFKSAISLIKGNMIVIIIEAFSKEENKKIDKFINDFEKKCDSLYFNNFKKCKYKIGISDIFKGVDNFKKSYYNALEAIKMVKNYEKGKNYIYYKDLEIKRFLMNNDFNELKTFVNKILGPLNTYEKSSKKDFLETLKIYIQTNCNWSKTKDLLHIHGNTLTYRLRRISEILDIDINDYNDRLRLQIAYEIIELLDH
ncbi:MAG: GAF domain-containing protein [Firmicutes bacterium]|nr:GAF domain-containing protein [Bacillota bacterium]